jgi:hypothetical protein
MKDYSFRSITGEYIYLTILAKNEREAVEKLYETAAELEKIGHFCALPSNKEYIIVEDREKLFLDALKGYANDKKALMYCYGEE